MGDVLVSAHGLSRVYQAEGVQTTALDSADFAIGAGQLIALTGPSGSGKTTLLHLISGIDAPTSGEISWPGLGAATDLRPLRIALAFQGPSLLPALSVAENVALPLLLGGSVSAADAAAAASAIIERMGLGDLSAKLPEELSGGQAQRVGLARALVVKPALLLADEPTGQQDHLHAARLLDLVLAIADEQGTAVLAATHDPVVAARMKIRWRIENGVLSAREEAIC
jgi:ABC-type lipoprotein export system ATPase subunit